VATFSADIDSISTGNEPRDGHVKSGDFFDAENHPKLLFKSTSCTKKDDEAYVVARRFNHARNIHFFEIHWTIIYPKSKPADLFAGFFYDE
jgi:hypothetical protein